MMKICFKVDANSHIGQGHVMRCLAIALYARKNRLFDSVFAIADDETEKLFIDNGFQYFKLGISYENYSEISAYILLEKLKYYDVNVIFIDSYYITEKYINTIKTKYKTACFFSNEKVISADLIVNYNINYRSQFYEENYQGKYCRLLLGSKFVPLREEFSSFPHTKKLKGKKILFLTGGSDPYDMVGGFIHLSKNFPEYDITIVVGLYNKLRHTNETADNVTCIPPSNNIAKIMAENDLVISAGGTTMYELCAIGIPAIVYSMADNQVSESVYMGEIGCIEYIGDVREGTFFWNKLKSSITQLLNDESKMNQMIKIMNDVVDGQGCRRIAEEIKMLGGDKMENQFEVTRKFWGREIIRANLIWPDEFVIRFVKRNYNNDKENTVVLDFGCGAGRNAVALASEGYKVIAMDYTEEAVEIINEKKQNLAIKAIKNEGLEVPVEQESVDAVIADGSLFCNNIKDTIVILQNIRKAMKGGGKFWANWRSTNDSLYGQGELLDNGLYKLGDGSKRDGCSYLFCDSETLREMYCRAGFEIESIDKYSYTENNGKNLCEWYFVVAQKNA